MALFNRNRNNNNGTVAVTAIENQENKAAAKRQAGVILGGDSQLKSLMKCFDVKSAFVGIPDSNGNFYYHIKLLHGDEVICDVQYCDFANGGKMNTNGITIGRNYTSYRISDVRRDLRYGVMRWHMVQEGVINPDADIEDVEEYVPTEAEKAAAQIIEDETAF